MAYRTNRVEVDVSAIADNARALHALLKPGVRMMAVVKADGYGHGAAQVSRAALAGGADMLAVALAEEGEALREAGVEAPILVLGSVEARGAEAVSRLGLMQTVSDAREATLLGEAAARRNAPVPVHLKLDTGMGRLGVRDAEAACALAQAVLAQPALRLAGAFTHFACADAPDDAYTVLQRERFEAMLAVLAARGVPIPLRHAANSAAVLRFPWAQYDLVRCGIALYGAPPVATACVLRSAVRWVTRAALVKEIPAGEAVSYGATYRAQRPTRVMTLPVGYADGYRRALGGVAQVLVRGVRAPIIGRVCMDQCMADVTDVPGCAAGDEVVLLGSQGAQRIDVSEMAAWLNTIDYEVLLAPGARVPRVYTER